MTLIDELRERTAMKFMGDCKCGNCQLVPKEMLVRALGELVLLRRLLGALASNAKWQNAPDDLLRLARAALQRIADDDVDPDLKGRADILSGIAYAALSSHVRGNQT